MPRSSRPSPDSLASIRGYSPICPSPPAKSSTRRCPARRPSGPERPATSASSSPPPHCSAEPPHDRAAGHDRRRQRLRRGQPAPAALPQPGAASTSRSSSPWHPGPRPPAARSPNCSTTWSSRHGVLDLELAPLTRDQVAEIVARFIPDAAAEVVRSDRDAVRRRAVRRRRARPPRRAGARVGLAGRRERDRRHPAGDPRDPSAGRGARPHLRHRRLLASSVPDAAGEVDEADAFAHLDAALASGAIERTDAGYTFRHRLVRDALLRDVPAAPPSSHPP